MSMSLIGGFTRSRVRQELSRKTHVCMVYMGQFVLCPSLTASLAARTKVNQ
jgi:hypothetical protein